MALSGGTVLALIVVDTLLRRLILPVVLLAAVILRYNLISFSYLLLLLVVFLLPGPRLKSQKVSNIIFLVILVVFSAAASLTQGLFQISLITSSNLTSSCDDPGSVLRQIGFVQFQTPAKTPIPAVDIVRHLLPDLIVLALSVVTLVFNALLVFNLNAKKSDTADSEEKSTAEENEVHSTEVQPLDSEAGVLADLGGPPYPKNVQCYWKIPSIVPYLTEFGIFIMLGLSGIAVPSLTSFTYYTVFLVLLVIWSLHMRLAALVRVLRILLTFYSALHLLVLHLFQFSSAQFHIQNGPCSIHVADCHTTSSLLARLFGLTPIILTDCSRPTELLLWRDLNYTVFLNPAFVFVLFWLLATDLRMWMFTPGILWRSKLVYYLPIQDLKPSSTVKCLKKTDSKTCQILEGSKSYGTMGPGGLQEDRDDKPPGSSSPDLVAPLLTPREKIKFSLPQKMWFKVQHYARMLWAAVIQVSFVFTVVAMMFWSVLYPSWPSLVLLLWSCGIWLIPYLNPRNSVVYTSPFLVPYSVALLIVQYVYSLSLMREEFRRRDDVVFECTEGTEEGCRSIVLLVKTCFTVVFFASFRDFVGIVKVKVPKWWRKRRHQADDSPDEDELSESTKINQDARKLIYTTVYHLMCTYWVVVVVGAFLLVMLTGAPSALKSIYLIFFFVFMITYQVAQRYWFIFSRPVWLLLVPYAAVHLILVYTYPFAVINNLWMDAYNKLNLTERNISADELFTSIGFINYYDGNRFRTLFETLVPLAVFIAALVLQLRYFKPRRLVPKEGAQVASQDTLDVFSLLPKTFRDALSKLDDGDIGEEESDSEENDGGEGDSESSGGPSPALLRKTTSVYSIKSSALKESHPKFYVCYRLTKYVFNKTRQIIVDLYNTFWRFMELHLHKIAVLVLFATCVSQISAAYWVLLVLVLVVVPLPFFNPLSYPLITLYLGLLTTTKMVYNLPVMRDYYLNFSSKPRPCSPIIDNKTQGIIYNQSKYFPPVDDTNWIGLHPTDEFAHYISLPVICSLLLSLWFSARRYQSHHYKSHGITVEKYERRSLFLNVSKTSAEVSIVASLKYLINHFFEIYGIEVVWVMLAVAVAVRIDVYGVVYVVALGVLFLLPQKLIRVILPVYLLLHGGLLALQYFFLLGAPPSVCYNRPNSTVYPWSNVHPSAPTALKKWLFIPDDTRQILNSHLLYADFLVYIIVCLQVMYTVRNPLKASSVEAEAKSSNFYEVQHWIDYFKVFVFQYSFWFSLFLLFFTAAYRISLFGAVYLLIGFYFLYRGQDMLRDTKSKRHKSWAFLRFATWLTLLIRVFLQIVDCVFWENVEKAAGVDNCLLILLFNGACTKQPYYGSGLIDCPDEPRNLGLWIDALNFIVVTIQIIIFDTQYTDIVTEELNRKVAEAQSFRKIFDGKVEEYQETQKKKQQREFDELVERTEKLKVSEKKIDHLLYAGVRVPDDIVIRRPKYRSSASSRRTEEGVDDDLLDSTILSAPGTPEKTAEEKEKSTARKIYDSMIETVDWLIEQLEQSSALYRDVVVGVKESAVPVDQEESVPLAQERPRYGSTDETSLATAAGGATDITEVEVHAEVHEDADVEGPVASKEEEKPKTKADKKEKKKKKKGKKSKTVGFEDTRGGGSGGGDVGDVIDELHIEPSVTQREQIEQFEGELKEKAYKSTSRLRRLSIAIYYFLLAHSDYPVFFFVILNIILNGSVLSLIYAILLYAWGLLSIPWPTRRFWLTLIFYTMSVLLIKYAFQFHDIPYFNDTDNFDPNAGLYPPRVLGILHRENFFTNAVWDILLLIALLLHRGLLVQYGLWNTDTRRLDIDSIFQFFHQLWHGVKDFFTRLFDPKISKGAKDYYTAMFIFDILCFITIVAGVNSFGFGIQTSTVQDLTAVADLVRNNNVPLTFVILLVLHFLSMVIDRAIYIRRSLPAKFVFQIILLLGWHIGLFFILPSNVFTGRPFSRNPAAQCLYFFKSCYFIAASFQIVSGYPARILRYLLTSSYNMVSWLAFQVYRIIPLFPELRETVDWTFTNTSLSLINWFKVQEIYSLVYLVKVQRTREKSFPRNLGEKQSWLVKIFAGGLLLIGLILLIWLPLLLISVISQASEANAPVEVDIKLSIGGFQPLVQLTVQERDISVMTPAQYENFTKLFADTPASSLLSREFRREDFSRVVFPGQSTALWTISPPSRDTLVCQLNPNATDCTRSDIAPTIPLDFSWSIKRAPTSNTNVLESVSGIFTRQLAVNGTDSTVEELVDSLTSQYPENVTISLPNLFPTLIQAPSSADSTAFMQLTSLVKVNRFNASCTAVLTRDNNTQAEWWTLTQDGNYVIDPKIFGQLEMIIYSERVAPQIFSLITGIGIIGLYVSVVLVIGRFIRTYIADLPYRLAVDEILNPDPLIKLCNDIYTVRESGRLELEEILVGKLFYIFRSSERIVKITEDLKEKKD